LLHRANALQQLGDVEGALNTFERLLAIDPTHAPAWSGSGTLFRELNRLDEAAHAFREALRHGADAELHTYYLSSVDGRHSPSTAPKAYVQTLFDDYADEFDEHLVGQLHYQAHRQLVGMLAELGSSPYRSALDLGCGTGLCGPLVRPMAERLTGLDLSPRMLEKAHALGAYDRLDHADVVEYLQDSEQRYDLVLAADVFIYVGDLDPVFAAVRRVMERGVFCFSVELVERGPAEFQLLPSLRYAHSEAYLRRLAAQHGFEILAMRRAPVRQDQREPIDGLFAYLAPAGA
jgi:predicted TPR repeat methyltransferase